ncbi:TrkH family potassium uptake protein [Clostridium tarantellae]|uniref:Trk family potassium uptake protein n=1 Tax=Clostridium tarantellae TaxID=39493 RepID=A0A6I1MIA0_9CLOT|nr:TrkH family potassium uptake protein [Clostridium tarantellae]MPQ42634.1 Trk family potassium uptake protein [Clostridium tarantellae]
MYINITKKIRLNAVQILALGFFLVILIGAILLSLPISSMSGKSTSFLDSLFTSTSAVCVTGLITVDTGTHWNYFGKTVIIILIQIGGLGFMSFTTLFALLLKKKITLKERLLLQEAMNTFGIQGLVRLIRYILVFTFSVELLGALLFATQFIPQFGIAKGIYYSIWHSISAFCNAGFDLMGNFSSLTAYSSNVTVLLTVSALIIIGGLGFTVWSELYNYKGYKRLSLHSKVVILITVILVLGGTILMLLFEFKNPNTLQPMGPIDKLTNAFFASVTTRTAGFNSINTSDMTVAGNFLTILLMFIGGSPGSTAGGIKTATFAILILTLISTIKGREDTEVFGRRLSKDAVYKAFTVFMIGVGIVIVVTMILSVTEAGKSLLYLLYEATSAFATVGLTLGITPGLSVIGKIVIMITMYLGRVGPMTVVLALANRKRKSTYKFPEDKILIG